MRNKSFAVFILTHGRPSKVYTYDALQKCGYTGRVYFILDDEDETIDEYVRLFGKERVIQFNKNQVGKTFDLFDNSNETRCIVFARNACFDIAKELGYEYFLQLDDDYQSFDYRLHDGSAIFKPIKNLDNVFDLVLDYYGTIPATSVALAQGGDFIGGIDNGKDTFRFSKRKAMNTFFCSTTRAFKFIGRINEDVNTYASQQAHGMLFLTIQHLSITQKNTQKNSGGMTELYQSTGTYLKSFYTVICAPSCVSIGIMNAKNKRIHHTIDWNAAVPCIVSPEFRK